MYLVQKLKSQSTWRLLGLGFITYGIYFAHYISMQSKIINAYTYREDNIPMLFVSLFMALSYANFVLFFAVIYVQLYVAHDHQVVIVDQVASDVWTIMLIVWGFMARNRVNKELGFLPDEHQWFHGLWTFMFSPMYFNYKINVLNENAP